LDAGNAVFDLLQVTAKLLPQRERGGVLTVRAANLDNAVKGLYLFFQGGLQNAETGQSGLRNHFDGGNVHGRGKGIVTGLSLVAMIVGMDGRFGSHLGIILGQYLNGPIAQHFVHIHVGLRTRSRLKDDEWKMFGTNPSAQHIVGRLGNGVGQLGRHLLGLFVIQGATFLDQTHGPNDGPRHAIGTVQMANGKIQYRSLRLGAVQDAVGNVEGAHGIGFHAGGQVVKVER